MPRLSSVRPALAPLSSAGGSAITTESPGDRADLALEYCERLSIGARICPQQHILRRKGWKQTGAYQLAQPPTKPVALNNRVLESRHDYPDTGIRERGDKRPDIDELGAHSSPLLPHTINLCLVRQP